MGYGKAFDLLSGMWNKWWSKEASQAGRANKIEKLEREQKTLSNNNPDGKHNRRLSAIARQLSGLYQKAKNSR